MPAIWAGGGYPIHTGGHVIRDVRAERAKLPGSAVNIDIFSDSSILMKYTLYLLRDLFFAGMSFSYS